VQVDQVSWSVSPCSRLNVDRTTPIGKMIDAYLRSAEDLDDRVIHLLFSANRWEARSFPA
jgi:thymidylate kinase